MYFTTKKGLHLGLVLAITLCFFSCSDTKQESSDAESTQTDSISGVGSGGGAADSLDTTQGSDKGIVGGVESQSSTSGNTTIHSDGSTTITNSDGSKTTTTATGSITTTYTDGSTSTTNSDGSTATTVTESDGSITATTTTPDGRKTITKTVTESDGSITATTTDSKGRKTTTTKTLTESDGSITATTTDLKGGKTTTTTKTESDGSITTTTTDPKGRKITTKTQTVTESDGSITTTTTDPKGGKTTVKTVIESDGSTTATTTTPDGRKTTTTTKTESDGSIILTTTDPKGRKTKVQSYSDGSTTTTQPNGTITKTKGRGKGAASGSATNAGQGTSASQDGGSGSGKSLRHFQKQAAAKSNKFFDAGSKKGGKSPLASSSNGTTPKKGTPNSSSSSSNANNGGYIDGGQVAQGQPADAAATPETKPTEAATLTESSATAGKSIETLNAVPLGRKYYIYPFAINAKNNVPVDAKIDLVEATRPKFRYALKPYEYNRLTYQENENPEKVALCKTFGYKPADVELDLRKIFSDTSKDFVALSKDTIFVRFALDRLRKRDVAVMFNVYFYHDAAVMQPKSIPELESLIDMLNENTKMKIRIHGHTNGGAYGKMITMAQGDTSFFKLDPTNKTTSGSAVLLSSERADVIKRYLIYKGISADRLQVKGWGGRKMLYEQSSLNASKNKRVEIEILQD